MIACFVKSFVNNDKVSLVDGNVADTNGRDSHSSAEFAHDRGSSGESYRRYESERQAEAHDGVEHVVHGAQVLYVLKLGNHEARYDGEGPGEQHPLPARPRQVEKALDGQKENTVRTKPKHNPVN